MPLSGSDVASKPSGTTASPNTTIESAKYNSTIDDIYTILNTVRTIAKGYTGASTAAGAVKNFGIGLLSDKSAGYTGLLADLGKIFRFTDTATLALDPAATLGNGWWCIVWANGGAVTIDPNSSEQVNGASTLAVANGDFAILACNGSAFRALRVNLSDYLQPDDIGVTVQGYDAELAALAALTSAANKIPMFSGSGTATLLDFKDEDNMASDSATAVPSQQSTKAYVDTTVNNTAVGVGQTWQDVAGSRTAGTAYQNTTGRPIQVSVELTSSTSSYFDVSSNNSAWVTLLRGDNDANVAVTAVIPDDYYYRVLNAFSRWVELR